MSRAGDIDEIREYVSAIVEACDAIPEYSGSLIHGESDVDAWCRQIVAKTDNIIAACDAFDENVELEEEELA